MSTVFSSRAVATDHGGLVLGAVLHDALHRAPGYIKWRAPTDQGGALQMKTKSGAPVDFTEKATKA